MMTDTKNDRKRSTRQKPDDYEAQVRTRWVSLRKRVSHNPAFGRGSEYGGGTRRN